MNEPITGADLGSKEGTPMRRNFGVLLVTAAITLVTGCSGDDTTIGTPNTTTMVAVNNLTPAQQVENAAKVMEEWDLTCDFYIIPVSENVRMAFLPAPDNPVPFDGEGTTAFGDGCTNDKGDHGEWYVVTADMAISSWFVLDGSGDQWYGVYLTEGSCVSIKYGQADDC